MSIFFNTITLDHLKEIPDYYTRLDELESEAKTENSDKAK